MSAMGRPPSPSEIGRLANNGMAVKALQDALGKMETSLESIPRLFTRVVRDGCWLDWIGEHGLFKHKPAEFRGFIEGKKPGGCATPLHILERILRGTPAWELYNEAIRGTRGGPNNPAGINQHTEVNRDNITVDLPATIPIAARDYAREAPTGNSISYALRRLKKHRPDLYERVKAGELTTHAAMVRAGFRRRTITIPDDPEDAARAIKKHFRGDRFAAFKAAFEAALERAPEEN